MSNRVTIKDLEAIVKRILSWIDVQLRAMEDF